MDAEVIIGGLGLFFTLIGSTWFLASRLGKIQGALDILNIKTARIDKLEEQHEKLEEAFRSCREQHLLSRKEGIIG